MSPARYFQSSLRDEGSLGTLKRGLKATATIIKSLRDFGTGYLSSSPTGMGHAAQLPNSTATGYLAGGRGATMAALSAENIVDPECSGKGQ